MASLIETVVVCILDGFKQLRLRQDLLLYPCEACGESADEQKQHT